MKTFKDFYQKELNEAYKDLGISKENVFLFAETLAPKIKTFKKQGVTTCARVDIDDEGKGITLGIAFVPDNSGYSEVANSCAKQFKSFFISSLETLGDFPLNQLGFKINLIGEDGSSNYSEIIIQFILPKDSGVVVSRAVVKELCIFFSKENHIDVLSNYGASKGFVKSVVNESYKHLGVMDLPYDDAIDLLKQISIEFNVLSNEFKLKYKDSISYDGVYVGELYFDESALDKIKHRLEFIFNLHFKGYKVEHVFQFYGDELTLRVGLLGFHSSTCSILKPTLEAIRKELFTKVR